MSYISVNVDIDDVIEQIDDDDLVREVEERGLKVGTNYLSKSDQHERLEQIHQAMLMGKPQTAYNLMYDYIRDVLGKAI
jgi:hypothetical protein